MPKRISETEIAVRIVPTSARWPDNPSVPWQKLRACVTALMDLARKVDNECDAAEADRGLSAEGIARRRREIAGKALADLGEFAPLKAAESAVATGLVLLEEKMTPLPDVPTELPEAMLAAEIRAHVSKQKDPVEFALKS